MINWLKKLRSVYFINRLLAFFIKGFKIKSFYAKWPLKGIVEFDIIGQKTLFYSNCDDYLVSRYYYTGFDEEIQEIALLESLMKDAKVFFDIGAFNGLFSIALGKKCPKLQVHCFEPHPANFERTKHNAAINKLDNVCLHHMGISDKAGVLDFYIPQDKSMTTISSFDASFYNRHSGAQPTRHAVATTSLDFFCEEKEIYPQFIKIDVEGHEYEVLNGAKHVIEAHRPTILCEIFTMQFDDDGMFQASLPKVYNLNETVKNLGYDIYMIEGGQLKPVPSLNINNAGRNFLFIPI